MIVYNTTIKVSKQIAVEWLAWQRDEHIPEIMHTRLFDDHKIYRILEPDDDDDGATFTIQYFTSSPQRYHQYIDQFAPVLRAKAFARWGDRFIAFRSVMQAVK